MKIILNIFLIISICLISLVNCGRYNLTKKVAKNSFGIQYFKVKQIKQIAFFDESNLILFADTINLKDEYTSTYPEPPLAEKCYLLNLKHNQSNLQIVETANFQEECEFPNLKYLDFIEINKQEFSQNKSTKNDNIIKIKFEKSRKDHIYVQFEIPKNQLSNSTFINIKSSIQKNHKPQYALLYPIVLPYDIIAGSLHSIGYIFFSIAWMNGALINNSLPIYRRIPNYILLGTYRTFAYLDDLAE
ncbi:hypothetical protein EHQ24_08180 [Leptospira noumeaensis]|uniref:Uncharacterized protein n=1 Tax=Leptospira noumeaensis TaxID=2484964 RepID=A0A4R9I9E8_9LEPT|nr:hypothetical protein [Leptospira noumeaensis]TGK82710.1 hypothetical protein EHQ24_08180 [Leptospira noumeaensis]